MLGVLNVYKHDMVDLPSNHTSDASDIVIFMVPSSFHHISPGINPFVPIYFLMVPHSVIDDEQSTELSPDFVLTSNLIVVPISDCLDPVIKFHVLHSVLDHESEIKYA